MTVEICSLPLLKKSHIFERLYDRSLHLLPHLSLFLSLSLSLSLSLNLFTIADMPFAFQLPRAQEKCRAGI